MMIQGDRNERSLGNINVMIGKILDMLLTLYINLHKYYTMNL